MHLLPQPNIYPAGDCAITLQWGGSINEAANQKVMQLFNSLQDFSLPFITDIIPAFNSITLVYDVVEWHKKNKQTTAFEQIKWELIHRLQEPEKHQRTCKLVKIPVCYHYTLALDLEEMVKHTHLTTETIIHLHCQPLYKVYMIGFLPGFPYMASVNSHIQMNRRAEPRQKVAKGSVGIAGEQTGIYPLDSPGGWQLIGQTPLNILDVSNENPCLLAPDDTVQFYPISLAEFEDMKKADNQ